MIGDGVENLLAHTRDRIERVHRALGDERDAGQAELADLFLGQLEHVDALEHDLARLDLARRADQAHQGQGDRRLARAGLADQPETLVGVEGEADAVDSLHRAPRRVVGHPQVLYVQDPRSHIPSIPVSRLIAEREDSTVRTLDSSRLRGGRRLAAQYFGSSGR